MASLPECQGLSIGDSVEKPAAGEDQHEVAAANPRAHTPSFNFHILCFPVASVKTEAATRL
jgi:hypothetical protein